MILKKIENEPLALTDENDFLLTESNTILSLIYKELADMFEKSKNKINISAEQIETLMTCINLVGNKLDEANKISKQLFNWYKKVNNF